MGKNGNKHMRSRESRTDEKLIWQGQEVKVEKIPWVDERRQPTWRNPRERREVLLRLSWFRGKFVTSVIVQNPNSI